MNFELDGTIYEVEYKADYMIVTTGDGHRFRYAPDATFKDVMADLKWFSGVDND